MTDDRVTFPPVFATNRPAKGETVADEVNRLLAGLREQLAVPPELAIASAYINPAGFGLIADEVERAPRVRLLLGAEPETPPIRRVRRPSPFEEHVEGLVDERDLTGFTIEADRAARRLVEWLRQSADGDAPVVEVRRLTDEFLHGKAFIAAHPVLPAVLAGSSNLTFAGLSRNRELNLGYPSSQYTYLVLDWFDELWDIAQPFDLAAIYEARWRPHEPWTVFLRMLHELYGVGDEDDFDVRLGLNLTGFQRDGVARSLRILDELGGVLVCDEVGLGKTFVAGEIIHQASVRHRQQVLVVVPAALKDSTWVPFLRRFGLYTNRVNVATYDDLRLGVRQEVQNLDQYALVVIDEAHNLRNTATQRARAVEELLGGEYRKKVVLLTATPINNSLHDLHALLSYFVKNDAQFASIGIPSIAGYIKHALSLDPESISPEHLFDLMDQVAVRRTRKFIKDNYRGEHLVGPHGRPIEIEFPTPNVYRADYDPGPAGQALLDAVIYSLEVPDIGPLARRLTGEARDPDRLSLARYTPSLYRLDVHGQNRQVTNSGLLRSALLKRLESSNRALANTLGRLVHSHETFLAALDSGLVLTGEALEEFGSADDVDEFLDTVDTADLSGVDDATRYDADELRAQVELDLDLLGRLQALAASAAGAGAHDAKAEKLLALIEETAKAAARPSRFGVSEGDRRKVIVFSTYTDTIRDLHDRVVAAIDQAPPGSALASYQGRIAKPIYGSKVGIDQESRAHTLARFAPATAGRLDGDGNPLDEDRYDLLLTTDVLSEGVNLQQAGHIINYDMPWNPQRMVQRHGRVDRIGSHHKFVQFGCFFPAANLDRLLHLEETLQRKLAYANAAIGVGEVLPGQVADPDVQVALADLATQQEQIRGLYEERTDLLEARGGSAALSGEEYRRRLERALSDQAVRQDVMALAYGSGSGFLSARMRTQGWVFCARIGDHPKPWFRYVAADESWQPATDEDGKAVIIDDTLSSLVAADPGGPDAEQELPEGSTVGVFDAWRLAQDHIHAAWTSLTDIANLQPDVPLALREAAELVFTSGSSLGHEAQADLLRRLNARWERRIVNAIRDIVRSDESAAERVAALAQYVKDEGLPLPEPPEPLPPVSKDHVRLVCWMAIAPQPAPLDFELPHGALRRP